MSIDKFTYGDISAPVHIIRSNRKTLGVQVNADGIIIVRSPLRLSESYIDIFLKEKAEWIARHIVLVKEESKKRSDIQKFTRDEIEDMGQKALEIIPERVKHYAEIIGVTYGNITIRNQKTRWGSCSSKGNLNFNCLLVLTPPEVLDSVVVHELCHRRHMNHSKDFYAEVYKAFPEYDKWNKWLKDNGSSLINRMF